MKAMLKRGAKLVVDRALRFAPRSMHVLADYINSTRPQDAAAERPRRRIRFDEQLARAGATLTHLDVLTLLQSIGSLPETSVHRYFTALFVARRLDLLEAAIDCETLGFAETRFFHRLKLQQYRGEVGLDADEIVQHFGRLRSNPLYVDAAANLAADFLARKGDAGKLAGFLQSLRPEDLTRLAPATFLGSFRLLENNGHATVAARLRDIYLDALPEEKRLYFLATLPEGPDSLKGAPWRKVLKRFAAVYSACDAEDGRQLAEHVVNRLRQLPENDRDLMNIRFDAGEREELLTIIRTHLQNAEGLALVRLGDGEGYGYEPPSIAGIDPAAFAEDNRIRERMWWGTVIADDRRAAIRQQFRQAVAAADIIGVPSIYRIIRDRGTPYTRFGLSGGQRGLAVVLDQLGKSIPVAGPILTEERCHQILFDRASIEALCQVARRVVLISCWSKEQLDLASHPDLCSIVIPAHTKVAKATGQGSETRALFDTFEDQVIDMERLCMPGTLVLVGAGFLGKIFIARAKAKGAVALDVGAMLDYFAGFKTRSLADLG